MGNSSSPGRSTSGPSVSLYRRFVVEESRITRDWPIHAAESFRPLGTEARPFKLICLSGDFVDQNERGRGLYVNIKGRLEKDLFGMEGPGLRTICLRAGGIIPTKEVCVNLFLCLWAVLIGLVLMVEQHAATMSGTKKMNLHYVAPYLVKFWSRIAITSTEVATAALKLATSETGWDMRTGEGWISNNDMKRIVTL